MNVPKVPPPMNTGWADFNKQPSVNNINNTENMFDFVTKERPVSDKNENDSWFDYADGFNMNTNNNSAALKNASTAVSPTEPF